MNKVYIKNKFRELADEEKNLIFLFSVIAIEGLPIDVAFNILKPKNPRFFNLLVDKLCAWQWLFSDCQTIYIDQQIAEAVLEVTEMNDDSIAQVLSSLRESIMLQPLDDMFAKRDYFVVARLFLTYLLKRWEQSCTKNSQLLTLFSDVAIAFSTNVELSYSGNKRQPVCNLEDRIDFRLLAFLSEEDGIIDLYKGGAFRLLGELYATIFRYEEAKECFQKAETFLDIDADLLFGQAKMYENLSLMSKAFQYAYRAYLINKENREGDANIKIALYIAYLCAMNDSPANSKYWRKVAHSLIGDRTIHANHLFSITLKEIEALLHLNDTALAHQIVDSAELEVYNLYGGNAPELARLSYIRSLIDGEVGHLRRSNEHYRSYVNTNHLNFGYSVGDTAVLCSGIINDHVIRGNKYTAENFAVKMQNLHAEGNTTAPGVRISQAFSNCFQCLANEEVDLSKAYLDVGRTIYDDELRPDDDTLKEIAPIFQNGIIPNAIMMTEVLRTINSTNINIALREGRIEEAKDMIDILIGNEKEDIEKLNWEIHLGRTLLEEGKVDEGVNVWRKILSKVTNAKKFEMAKDIAEWAQSYGLTYESIEFYEEALQPEAMVYGRTCDIANALQRYAEGLELCGMKENDELWRQALMLMQSLGDKDDISLLYFSWGLTKQDYEAECFLKKAIELWEPEHDVFDETLSYMNFHLALSLGMQGKTDETRVAANESVRLFPAEYPVHLYEEIEAYL